MTGTEPDASTTIEALLVAENPRGMRTVRAALSPGYLERAARCLLDAPGPVAIITGFPVGDTVETDGPVGAWVLYEVLANLGRQPLIWAEPDLTAMCFPDHDSVPLPAMPEERPGAVVVIERPGAAADGRFYNIRGSDISDRCLAIEPLLDALACPIIAIGDGGNEVGMGKVADTLAALPIKPATQSCDELVVGDVSNWAAYGLAAMLEWLAGQTPTDPASTAKLAHLVSAGVVDGVSGAATPTEDGYPAHKGASLAEAIRGILATRHSDRNTSGQ